VSTATTAGLPPWASRLLSELSAADARAERIASSLTPQQLNWQPQPGAWSVGQCFDHLYRGNEVYLPAIAAALEGKPHATTPEIHLSWFSRYFIRNYIAPNPEVRAKAPKKVEPAAAVDRNILALFLRSNQTARDLVISAAAYDVNAIRFKNPFIPLLRFTVGTGLEITAKHEGRHLLQAENVKMYAGFPQ
jgi:hypothetical protein